MIFRIFWIAAALDLAAVLLIWALFDRYVHPYALLLLWIGIGAAVIAGGAFLAFRSESLRVVSLAAFLIPSVALVGSAVANLGDRIWTNRRFSGDAYFRGSARELAHALAERDVDRVKQLLPAAGDLNQPQGEGMTLLQFGILQADDSDRSLEMVQALLKAGANPKRDADPLALEHAIATGPRLTKVLLEAGANPNVLTRERRPVWWSTIASSASNDLELLTMFLEHGADVQWRDEGGHGPVGVAANAGRWRAATLLIEHGAGWQRESPTAGATVAQSLTWKMIRWQESGTAVPEDIRKMFAAMKKTDPKAAPDVPEAPPAGSADIGKLVHDLNPSKPEEYNAVLARLVKEPRWVQRTGAFLDPEEVMWVRSNAAFLLALKADAVDEGTLDQCWEIVRSELTGVPAAGNGSKEELNGPMSQIMRLARMAQGLGAVRGAARERHRADFDSVRERVEQYRKVDHPDAGKLPLIGEM